MKTVKYFHDLTIINVTQRVFYRFSHLPIENQSYSLELIRKGEVGLRRDHEFYHLKGPALFWMSPGHVYQYVKNEQDITPYEHLWIDMAGERAKRMINALDSAMPEHFLPISEPGVIGEAFMEICKDFRNDKKEFHGRIAAKLEYIMWLIQAERNPPCYSREEDHYGISVVTEQIRQNPFQNFDFEKIASELSLSYDYFRRLFREKNGQPVYEYILEQRMIQASELLRSGKMRIKEIAVFCGFNDLSSFSRSFRKYAGISPRNFLRKINEKNSSSSHNF